MKDNWKTFVVVCAVLAMMFVLSCEKEPYCELKDTCSIDRYGDLYNCGEELICYD